MSHKVNLVRVLTSATGTSSPIALGAAYSQLFMLPSEAGAMDGRTYTYLIVDGNNWELGRGAYTASGTTLARTTIIASRISGTLGTSKITLSGTAQVRIIESADDMDGVRGTRVVTGTSDTLNNSDLGYVVTYSNASAVAVSLAQASVSNLFLDGWAVWVQNLGASTVTVTPATSTVNGASTLVLPTNIGAMIWSDGTNYHAYFIPVTKPLLAANNLSDVASAPAARTNLGLGTSATLASAAVAQTANNLSDLGSASTARTNLGLGSSAVLASSAVALTANNLSDLASVSTARTNLGLGSASTLASSAVAQTANNLSDLGSVSTARANLGIPAANILINPDFRINQRGYVATATLSAGTYGHDRWKAGASGGDYTFSQVASDTPILIASGKTLIQVVEDKNVAGGSYVLSWGGTAQARVGVNTATPSGSYASSPILITGQTAGTVMSVEFNSAGILGTPKLESGTVATPFVMRSYAAELADCKRYCERISSVDNNFKQFAVAVDTSTISAYVLPICSEKRAIPTVTMSAASTFTIHDSAITGTSISSSQPTRFGVRLTLTVASGATSGYASLLQANNTTAAYIQFDAEL
jgi:hypothetical protein